MTGDWDGDGVDTVGVVAPNSGSWFLRNSNSPGAPDVVFGFGAPGWTPVVGDWDGDGVDTIGSFDPTTGSWFLRNSNSSGTPDITFGYGAPGWTPVVGDWNSDGTDTIGSFEPVEREWFLRNSNSSGPPDFPIIGYGGPGWTPVTGDWDGDGEDTIGAVGTVNERWFLRNSNSHGAPDIPLFSFGGTGSIPVTGYWGLPLRAAEPAAPGTKAAPITDADLAPISLEAMARLTEAGIDARVLSSVDVIVADLSGDLLGFTSGNRVLIDADAAGHGWFVDRTPWDDVEFNSTGSGDLVAAPGTPAGRMDLLTVITHEYGHVLGFDHDDAGVMDTTLPVGVRRLVDEMADSLGDELDENAVDAVFAGL